MKVLLYVGTSTTVGLLSLSWSWQPAYYEEELLPILKAEKVLYFTHADSRLANNDIPDDVQQLRCRTNYRALKYVEPIEKLGKTLLQRLQSKGPFIALHLRLVPVLVLCVHCRKYFMGSVNLFR